MDATLDALPPRQPLTPPASDGGDDGRTAGLAEVGVDARTAVFSPRARVADLTGAYPELAFTCAQLGFGAGPTLEEWCRSPRWALLSLARAALPPSPAPSRDWTLATIPELIGHIVAHHHRVLRNELARLQLLIDHLAQAQPVAVLAALAKVFREFHAGMLVHLDMEESGLFPLCIRLEDAALNRCAWDDEDVTTLLRFTSHGHLECEAGLRRCRELAAAAATATQDPDVPLICVGLAAIASDLATHTALEGDLLIPAAIFAQDQVRARRKPQRH